ncbi:MAG: YbaB/EbfC family nucleoid-associated protein [Proteobacteria bacterium]|nr:YbaB/EbfC family nucleoid-associated protein [Pseudomonadota bacterium]MBU1546436.1 YbaB/EbfC family nucleoid-associated protein [Pseudomonadota bacterium]MBU2620607.1 YbaB/EbfC family nucleoid-associated protein [Pseudomonadota bacterium]MDP2001902.1 YbaB/EbfC family nucleoid-associated protein [Desulfurivibrionaceae bacterium]
MDMKQMVKQAQQFQQRLTEMQGELAGRQVSASVGGGMVSATVNGRHELVSLTIDKEVVDPSDPQMLQDLVVSAVNEAMRKAQAMIEAEMAKITGGIKIPGMF